MNIFARLLFRLPKNTRRIVRTCLYGLVAGLAAVAFHVGIELLFKAGITTLAWESPTTFALGTLLILLTTGAIVGVLLYRVCPEAAGSGIPQMKLAFWKDFGVVPLKQVVVKFFAGIISVGGGSSLGREGPSVQIAGGLASYTAQLLGEPKQNRREATAAGAAAGLAAAFNTPIAAVTFVLEEVIQDLNSRLLGPVLLASIVGAFTVYATLGAHPAFQLPEVTSVSWTVYIFIPFIAAAAALIGGLFQRFSLGLRQKAKSVNSILGGWWLPVLGALVTWLVGCSVFLTTGHIGVFGLGYADLSAALSGGLAWKLAGILLAGKLIATIACYGLGGCGGIFAPSLFFGGMTGLFLAGIIGQIAPGLGAELTGDDRLVLVVVGMSACLGAVVRAPITSILIVFEMTHQFSLVPALMLGTLISQGITLVLSKHNFYEQVLLQDGHNLDHVIPPRDLQTWQRLPVSAIANFQPVSLPDVNPETLRQTLKSRPYNAFPVVNEDGEVEGILTRREANEALAEDREPKLNPAKWCQPTNTIRELQMMLIESTTGVVLIRDSAGGKLLGLVTLHDLLRAQVSIAGESP